MKANFGKLLFWLGLVHEMLGAAIAHTAKHNTLTAIDTGIQTVEGVAASVAPSSQTQLFPIIDPVTGQVAS